MTDIDIERLREIAEDYRHYRTNHWDDCCYSHGWCAVLALIERLEKAEAERDELAVRLSRTVGYEHPMNAPADVSLMDVRSAWAYGWNECKDVIMAKMENKTDE